MSGYTAKLRQIDFLLIAVTAALAAVGLVVLYGLGLHEISGFSFLKKQILWVGAGFVVMTAAAFFDYNKLKHYIPFIYGFNVLLLAIVFLVGKTALGAQRWIQIGAFRFQPSEFTKLIVIIAVAAYLAEKKDENISWRKVLVALAAAAPNILLIAAQPDLGTALVLAASTAGLLVAAGVDIKKLLIMAAVVVSAGLLVYKFNLLHDYQMKRLMVFINPSVDPLGSGYNLRQSIIAVGSGGLLGKGAFSGTQSRLNFLPPAVRHTDFIFAVIGEEFGFAGGTAVLLLLFLLTVRALRAAVLSRNHFGLLVAAGIASMWMFQVLVNIGMTIGIMPVTGIPLPFISYGGSSVLMNTVAVGLLLGINYRRWA